MRGSAGFSASGGSNQVFPAFTVPGMRPCAHRRATRRAEMPQSCAACFVVKNSTFNTSVSIILQIQYIRLSEQRQVNVSFEQRKNLFLIITKRLSYKQDSYAKNRKILNKLQKRLKTLVLRRFGATDVTRTHDLLITNQLLYQLSYSSIFTFGDPLRRFAMLTLTTTDDLLITSEMLYH